MPVITTNMGLRSWNTVQDLYDHAQLADNWNKVDQHDHSTGKGVQIPTAGIADNAITAAKIVDGAVDLKLGNIESLNIVGDTGQPAFNTGWTALAPYQPAFYKERGRV